MQNERMAHGECAIVAQGLYYRYGRRPALDGIDLSIPEGATYALLGPNGSGKTTLLHVLAGLRRASAGHARVLGRDPAERDRTTRQSVRHVGEGQQLPRWMRIHEYEAFLRPLYPTWDVALADQLRRRFQLDPTCKLGALSRGEYMKAALLFALASHPRVLLMDEPFTGMDVSVKDELVRGLLDSATSEGCTTLVCSHDLQELEPIADWIGFLAAGRMMLSESMASVQERFRHVDVLLPQDADPAAIESSWLSVERSGRRLRFIATASDGASDAHDVDRGFPHGAKIDIRPATLREVFLALADRSRATDTRRVEAA